MGPLECFVDLDGDGWGVGEGLDCDDEVTALVSGDCDDTNPQVHPLQPEQCNGLDDDCDGALLADEIDGDGDLAICEEDCAPEDPMVHAGLAEVCDGLDNDCDGLQLPEEQDQDGDGVLACADDCDDTDDRRYPGASELCDGLDNDCDLVLDEDERDLDADGLAMCDGDCDDTNPHVLPSAPEVCDGLDNDCDGHLGSEEADDDGDGAPACADCDDSDPDPTTFVESCDGLDTNCDGAALGELDSDGDGVWECALAEIADDEPWIRLRDAHVDLLLVPETCPTRTSTSVGDTEHLVLTGGCSTAEGLEVTGSIESLSEDVYSEDYAMEWSWGTHEETLLIDAASFRVDGSGWAGSLVMASESVASSNVEVGSSQYSWTEAAVADLVFAGSGPPISWSERAEPVRSVLARRVRTESNYNGGYEGPTWSKVGSAFQGTLSWADGAEAYWALDYFAFCDGTPSCYGGATGESGARVLRYVPAGGSEHTLVTDGGVCGRWYVDAAYAGWYCL